MEIESNGLYEIGRGIRWMRSVGIMKIWSEIGVGIKRSANVGDFIIWIIIGIERAIYGVASFLKARLAGDLDGDPSEYHRSDCDHRRRYCRHSDSDSDSDYDSASASLFSFTLSAGKTKRNNQ